jgi:hypothetical protein
MKDVLNCDYPVARAQSLSGRVRPIPDVCAKYVPKPPKLEHVVVELKAVPASATSGSGWMVGAAVFPELKARVGRPDQAAPD